MYQINSKCTNRNICSYFSRYKFHSGNQKKNRKVCQNQRCCITPYIVIYSVLATNIEISLHYLKHAAGILYFHSKQPESSSCAGIPAGTSILSGWWNMSTQWKTGSGSFSGLSVESAQFILDIGKFCNWISFFLADGQHLSFWHTCFWLFEFKISDIWQQLSYRTKLRTTDLMALPLFFHLFLWWIFFFIFFTSSWIFWKDSSLIVCSIRHASWFAVSGDTLSVLRIY